MRKRFTSQPAQLTMHDLLEFSVLGALYEIERLINWPSLEPLLPNGRGEIKWF